MSADEAAKPVTKLDAAPVLEAEFSLTARSFIQQTTRLRNTVGLRRPFERAIAKSPLCCLTSRTSAFPQAWVFGLVVYSGNETKFGKNKAHPSVKLTKTDHFINRIAVWLFIFQLVLVVLFGSIGEMVRNRQISTVWYVSYDAVSDWYDFLIIPLRFLLLNSTFIPISLKLTLDLCKVFYAYFINCDLELYDEASGEYAHANSTSISEDLGQVQFLLTDKTGTLTQNNMIFKMCSIEGSMYDSAQCKKDGALAAAVENGSAKELGFLRNMALNNGVMAITAPEGEEGLVYKGASPDEVALVKAAATCGVELVYRGNEEAHVKVNGVVEKWKVLRELEFSSERRRMSTVLQNINTLEVIMYSKGADDMLSSCLEEDEEGVMDPVKKDTFKHLEVFACNGLRTLFFTERSLSFLDFATWDTEYQAASIALENRKTLLEQAYAGLEHNLRVQGASAIEDKLQEGVPETIKLLRKAGIKVWMLTGDKYRSVGLLIGTCPRLTSKDIMREPSLPLAAPRSRLPSPATSRKQTTACPVSVRSR